MYKRQHRSQINLDQKVKITEEGVERKYGFAKYLHDSLPNATYVGFTGTPVDKTIEVFGEVVDAYTTVSYTHLDVYKRQAFYTKDNVFYLTEESRW